MLFKRLLLLLVTIFSSFAGVAGQERQARPVARLIAAFQSESQAPARSASPPTTKSNTPDAAPPSLSLVAQPVATTVKAQTDAIVPAEVAQMEQRVFALVNETRAKQGLTRLAWDEKAAQMARRHAANMALACFFNHIDPQGRDTVARAGEAGLRGWRALSENIAYNKGYDQPADFAVERWLLSAKHHDNIVLPMFTHTAVGVALAADGRIYFTQVFLAR